MHMKLAKFIFRTFFIRYFPHHGIKLFEFPLTISSFAKLCSVVRIYFVVTKSQNFLHARISRIVVSFSAFSLFSVNGVHPSNIKFFNHFTLIICIHISLAAVAWSINYVLCKKPSLLSESEGCHSCGSTKKEMYNIERSEWESHISAYL